MRSIMLNRACLYLAGFFNMHFCFLQKDSLHKSSDQLVVRLVGRALSARLLHEVDLELDCSTNAKTQPGRSHRSHGIHRTCIWPSPSPVLLSLPRLRPHWHKEHRHYQNAHGYSIASIADSTISAAARAVAPLASSGSSGTVDPYHPKFSLEEISADEFLKITGDPAHEPLIVDWEAKWCRKCKYLKPKLAKLQEVFPKLRFVSLDVNKAPMTVVQGAGVTKMPTVQIWKQGQSVNQVIGGEDGKAVVEKIRSMLQDCTTMNERGEIA